MLNNQQEMYQKQMIVLNGECDLYREKYQAIPNRQDLE